MSSESANGNVSIGTSAAIIKAANGRRESLVVQNVHASQVLYIGDGSVTTSNGLRIPAGESMRLQTKAAVYGIASGASTDVRYFEEF